MGRPVIGLSTYVEPARWGAWEVPAALLHEWYVDAVRAAGGRAVLLPPDTTDDDVLDRIDGLILIGGADVSPAHYGAEPHPTVDTPRVERDASELLLCRGVRARDLPLLGICRGMQVMAIAHGGSLIQDLPDAGYGLAHRERPGTFTQHDVRFAPDSRIAHIYGTSTLSTNSSHHQGIADPGTLTPTGWANDGLVEVLEALDSRFTVGVQWHPEHPDRRTAEMPLFRALVDAARDYRGVT
jgi:putative glutamine amidotransferase